MQLYITEKPSVARGLKDFFNKNGAEFKMTKDKSHYLDKDQAIMITWSVGHIMGLYQPNQYNPAWKHWNINDLPLVPPNGFKKYVKKEFSDRYKAISGLLQDATTVIHCGDPDREGQCLIDEIIESAKYTGAVKRLLLNALDDRSIKRALESMESNTQYQSLYRAGEARSYIDWLVGINLTRYYTAIAKNGGYSSVFSVGRVQTPVLSMIVERDRAIRNFKPEPFFTVHPILIIDGKEVPASVTPADKYKEKSNAEALQQQLNGQTATVTSIEKKEVVKPIKELHNLDSLQILANKRFGLSPQDTLKALQGLYEKKFTTYPRSDCKYLPEGQLKDATTICTQINDACILQATIPVMQGSELAYNKPIPFNDKKITAHHAIIPTTQPYNRDEMTDNEYLIYTLVAEKYASMFFSPYTYNKEVITFSVPTLPDKTLTVSIKNVTDEGYQVLYNNGKYLEPTESDTPKDRDENEVSGTFSIQEQDTCPIANVSMKEGMTKAPTSYTEGTIIQAMTNIVTDDPELNKKLKEVKGIGTPATRAGIIERLIQTNQITVKQVGKQKTLFPTHKAEDLYDVLPSELKSAAYTALMELQLDEVEAGTMTTQQVIDHTMVLINQLIKDSKPPVVFNQAFPCPICKKGFLIRKSYCRDPEDSRTRVVYFRCTECNKTMQPDSTGEAPEYVPCPKCNEGYIVEKHVTKGDNAGSVFWGCSNYPKCKQSYSNEPAYRKIAKQYRVEIKNTEPSNFDSLGKIDNK